MRSTRKSTLPSPYHVVHIPLPSSACRATTTRLPVPFVLTSEVPRPRQAHVRCDERGTLLQTWFTPSQRISDHDGIESRDRPRRHVWDGFGSSSSSANQETEPISPPDERTLKLGRTLRILQPRLPTLLSTPLPNDLLSPHISLHLFPSTHPHLPTANGRVAYHAALWTAPISWGCVPIVGNVELEILNERMVKDGSTLYPSACTASANRHGKTHSERLIVRWRTRGKTKGKGKGAAYKGIGAREQVDKITHWLGGGGRERDDQEFTGLFIFEFDEEGRILTHTIEHAEDTGDWDRASRVVSITDWLLARVNGNSKDPGLAVGYVSHAQPSMNHGTRISRGPLEHF